MPAGSLASKGKLTSEAISAQAATQCALIMLASLIIVTMHSTEISVQARYEALPLLLAEITHQAEILAITSDVLLRLQLLVEEIFLNTVTHGFGGDSENTVQLGIRRKDDRLTLHYEDGAPPFDISQAVTRVATSTEIGGLGIGLIHGLCKAMRYQRQGSRNISEFDF